MKTVIASSSISGKKQPGGNQQYVNSRKGGPTEASRTKQASIKHQNPEYFKRQTDRKSVDGGPGSGPQNGGSSGMSAKEQYYKNNPPVKQKSRQQIASENFAKTGANVKEYNKANPPVPLKKGNPLVNRKHDQGGYQMKQFSKGTMY